MQAKCMHLLAVGEIEPERTERRAYPHAAAIAYDKAKVRERVSGIAGVDECGEAPGVADPSNRFDAADRVVPAADRSAALLDPEAFEGVAAYRRVAAGPEQERRGDAFAGGGDDGSRLGAE